MRTGKIFVSCYPNTQVYIDSELIDQPIDKKGMMIPDVSEGHHIIEIKREGFTSQRFKLLVRPGETEQINIKTVLQEIQVSQQGDPPEPLEGVIEQRVGNLKFSTIPLHCKIILPEITVDKEKEEVTLFNLPIGEKKIQFIREDVTLDFTTEVHEGITREIKVDFIAEEIIDMHALNRPSVIELIDIPVSTQEVSRSSGAEMVKLAELKIEDRIHSNFITLRGVELNNTNEVQVKPGSYRIGLIVRMKKIAHGRVSSSEAAFEKLNIHVEPGEKVSIKATHEDGAYKFIVLQRKKDYLK